jgi:uncharacterized protein (TIGR02594 family)
MKTEVTLESLEGMSFADYKKALKKDKKFLKKANGVMFVNDHKFSDGKKGLAMMIFKKPKEVKECFKDLKKKGHPSPKMAGGSCKLEQGENGPEFKVELKLGSLKEDKIMAKGKTYFQSVLGLIPTIVAPDPKDSDGQIDAEEQEEINDLVADLSDIRKMGAAVKTAITNFKSNAANQDDAEAVEDFVNDAKEWLIAFKNETPDVKSKLKDHALKLKEQYVKLNPLVAKIQEQADENDPKSFLENMMDKAGDFVGKVKDKVEDIFDGDNEAWEDDDVDDIGDDQVDEDNDQEDPQTGELDDDVDGDLDDSTQTDDDVSQEEQSQPTAPVVNELPVANNIEKSVGKGGTNDVEDVKVVQTLLNEHGASLTVDGDCGAKTIAAIEKFQKDVFGWSDGRVDPDGKTWGAMAGAMPPVDDGQQGDQDLDDDDEEMIEVGGSGPSSSYFSFKEMVSPNDPVYKANNGDPTKVVPQEYWPTMQKLMKQLDVIRAALGVAVTVNSAYRSPEHNKNVGGVANSQHLFGKAADLSCSISPQEVHAIIAGLMQAGKIAKGGLGLYNTFVHYDIRGSLANWNNSGFTPLPPKMPTATEDDNTDDSNDQDQGQDDTTDTTQEVLVTPNKELSAAVGQGKANVPEDVAAVQFLLNKEEGTNFTVDGIFTSALSDAITTFQKEVMKFSRPDGVVDPGGKTWKGLNGQRPGAPPPGPLNKPNWIQIAEREIGVKENTSKTEHNPRVIEYHATTGGFKDDETPWCSSFVNWVMKKAGHGGTNSAAAVSWKNWGQKVDEPAYGAIAVIDWDGPGPGWKGHVGFVVGKQGSSILLLGGNQANAVNVKTFGTSKVVAYVYPSGFDIPQNFFTFGEASGDFGDEVGFDGSR